MINWFPNRLNIVAQGDSWFAYPRKWIIAGKPSNLLDHISAWTKGKANLYTMASNGAEAVDMLSGKQKHELIDVLRWHSKGKNRKPIDLLLFSGGGNGVVGENDFERFLRLYQAGFIAKQCIRLQRLKRKCRQIRLAYAELLDICDQYSPSTVILTHCYDYPYASLQGGVFLGGLIKTKSWMKPYLDKLNIPDELQSDVIKIFMDSLATEMLKLKSKHNNFIVVDTRGTLMNKKNWLDELHPDAVGFKKIAAVMYSEMVELFPQLKLEN